MKATARGKVYQVASRAAAQRLADRLGCQVRLALPSSRRRNPSSILEAIRSGDRVTIVDRFGKERTGRAVMLGPYGWVLNMGGAHGTPAVATADNIVKVSPRKPNPSRSARARAGRRAKRTAYGSARRTRAADARARAIRAGGTGKSELARFKHMLDGSARRAGLGNPSRSARARASRRTYRREVGASRRIVSATRAEMRAPRGSAKRKAMSTRRRFYQVQHTTRRARHANPRRAPAEVARAAGTFRKWHGFDAHQVTTIKGPKRRIPATLVKLGELPEITYTSDKWKGKKQTYVHRTSSPRPVLATDPSGRDLFIVGGRVRVTADGLVG
jgi:hypothetical protein